jgi:predicted RNA binding protein YcfA (HicA-like mRNA interferase family)
MNGWYNQVVAVLQQHGYYFLRAGKGSHDIWTNGTRNQVVSKNMPSRHMANAIMKQAGIQHHF